MAEPHEVKTWCGRFPTCLTSAKRSFALTGNRPMALTDMRNQILIPWVAIGSNAGIVWIAAALALARSMT